MQGTSPTCPMQAEEPIPQKVRRYKLCGCRTKMGPAARSGVCGLEAENKQGKENNSRLRSYGRYMAAGLKWALQPANMYSVDIV